MSIWEINGQIFSLRLAKGIRTRIKAKISEFFASKTMFKVLEMSQD